MRFHLLKRFSHLIHRRTRSDSAIVVPVAAADIPHSSSSFNCRPNSNLIDSILPPAPIFSPICCDTSVLASGRPVAEISTGSASSPTHPAVQNTGHDTRRTAELPLNYIRLSASIDALKSDMGMTENAIRGVKNDLQEKRSQLAAQKRRSADLALQVQLRTQEVEQCEQLFDAVSSAGLIDLAQAHAASSSSPQDFQEAAVDAIQDAADSSSSIWSKIVGLVVGPRASDNYLSAIKMTLKTRREIKHVKKVIKFWKKTAQGDEKNANVVTPSSSNLSQVLEPLSEQRKKAVEELRERRKAAARDTQGVLSQSSSNASITISYRLPESQPSIASVLSTLPSATSGNYEVSASSSQQIRRASALPPLASDSFKQELMASHSSERLFSSASYKLFRSSSSGTDLSKDSEPLRERKTLASVDHVVISEDKKLVPLDVDKADRVEEVSSSFGTFALSLTSSTAHRHGPVEFANSHLWTTPKPDPSCSSLISAERALESFERICTRFSSGSSTFGSLHTINEDSLLLSCSGSAGQGGSGVPIASPPPSSTSGSTSRSSSYWSAVDAALIGVQGLEMKSRRRPSSFASSLQSGTSLSAADAALVGAQDSEGKIGRRPLSFASGSSFRSNAMGDATLVDAEGAGIAGVGTFSAASSSRMEAFEWSHSEETKPSDRPEKSFPPMADESLIELELASVPMMKLTPQTSRQDKRTSTLSTNTPKKSMFPILSRIPSLSAKFSLVPESSSRKSLSSIRTSSTMPTTECKEKLLPPQSKKVGISGFKPVLPLRVIKKSKQ